MQLYKGRGLYVRLTARSFDWGVLLRCLPPRPQAARARRTYEAACHKLLGWTGCILAGCRGMTSPVDMADLDGGMVMSIEEGNDG